MKIKLRELTSSLTQAFWEVDEIIITMSKRRDKLVIRGKDKYCEVMLTFTEGLPTNVKISNLPVTLAKIEPRP